MSTRPRSTQRQPTLDVDEDDEDAPAVVHDADIDDNADSQHGSLRAAFPMAFGASTNSGCVMSCQVQTS